MKRILIADDSTDFTDFLSVLLQLNDFDADTASSKILLMGKIKTFIPDLILLDVVFNRIDGRSICKEIKGNRLYCNIPIILISANGDLLKNFKDFQADDVVEKPFDLHTILGKINIQLDK